MDATSANTSNANTSNNNTPEKSVEDMLTNNRESAIKSLLLSQYHIDKRFEGFEQFAMDQQKTIIELSEQVRQMQEMFNQNRPSQERMTQIQPPQPQSTGVSNEDLAKMLQQQQQQNAGQ